GNAFLELQTGALATAEALKDDFLGRQRKVVRSLDAANKALQAGTRAKGEGNPRQVTTAASLAERAAVGAEREATQAEAAFDQQCKAPGCDVVKARGSFDRADQLPQRIKAQFDAKARAAKEALSNVVMDGKALTEQLRKLAVQVRVVAQDVQALTLSE